MGELSRRDASKAGVGPARARTRASCSVGPQRAGQDFATNHMP
jgi:hypothetical protein